MAIGTHVVPSEVPACPVPGVIGGNCLFGVKVEPALATDLFWPRVPGDRQGLIATTGKGDQVLLQRINTEGVGDRIFLLPAIGSICANEEAAIFSEEGRRHTELRQGTILEVAQDRSIIGVLHRFLVMGTLPKLGFLLMTANAGLLADAHRREAQPITRAGQRRAQRLPQQGGLRSLPIDVARNRA
jgi:hypothetical protein